MSINKNLSLRQIAIYAAICIMTLILLLTLFFSYQKMNATYLIKLLGFFLIGMVGTYLILVFFLDKFIYRKIKLVYKIIRKSKVSTEEKKMNLDEEFIGNVRDEVARWAADQADQIEALKKLESYRRDFVGDISHELKTPIFNIQGYIHTLIDGGIDDSRINRKYLVKAGKNVDRLQNIVQDLDVISRMESGSYHLEERIFDIRALCIEVFEHLEMQSDKKGINLHFKEGADYPFKVKADRENIRQVLINLISNSIKYGKQGGYVKTSLYDMDKYILVEISDDGIGIEEKHLSRLFNRFYRVEKSRSREEGGTGLGLSIVKHILEAHHQTIHVRSTPGLGSTFGFTLQKG